MSKRFKENLKKCPINIESFGGTGGLITGSCHRVEIGKSLILVDSGMYQGKFEERSARGERRNFEPIKDMANGVTDVLESHVHIDHTGRLPMIFKKGFTPRVLATEETAAFMEPMLRNSAEIQAQENIQNRLYEMWDVEKTLRHIKIVKPFVLEEIGQKHSNVTAEFLMNCHVMGSASIVVRDHDSQQSILFTGDMGKPDQSLCGGYKDFIYRYPNDPINTMVVESTYFDKNPIPFEEKKANLLKVIREVWKGGGNPLFPTLSFHRAQEIIEMFHNFQESGEIPEDCHIYIDAPLAMKLLDTFKDLGPDYLSTRYGNDPEFYKNNKDSIGRFELKNSLIIETHESSQLWDKIAAKSPSRMIILASGGMGGYGRAMNYIYGEFGKNPKNAIVLTCFQVAGTEGARLLHQGNVSGNKKEGAKVIKVDGFTSHISGPKETFEFLERFNLSKLNKVIITHGKDKARQAMADEFKRRGYSAEIILSRIGQVIEI